VLWSVPALPCLALPDNERCVERFTSTGRYRSRMRRSAMDATRASRSAPLEQGRLLWCKTEVLRIFQGVSIESAVEGAFQREHRNDSVWIRVRHPLVRRRDVASELTAGREREAVTQGKFRI